MVVRSHATFSRVVVNVDVWLYYNPFVVKSESHRKLLANSIRTSRDRIQFYDKNTQQHWEQFCESKQTRTLRDHKWRKDAEYSGKKKYRRITTKIETKNKTKKTPRLWPRLRPRDLAGVWHLQTADCRLQTADCRLQIADCRLQTADCSAYCRLATNSADKQYLSLNTHLK